MKVIKAKVVKDPNKYIWIVKKTTNKLISNTDFKFKLVDKSQGIGYYHIKEIPYVWRFEKSKGWTEITAQNYLITQKNIKKSMTLKEKMQKLADKSNVKFQEFMEWAKEKRADVVKSVKALEKTQEKGFKIFGEVQAYKKVVKAADGTEQEKLMLKTRFTSNKADLYWDITSKDAISKAIEELNSKSDVLAIRFEHGEDDYGIWDRFWTEEVDGVFYGFAEGELDTNLNRAKDLWTEIYEYGKKFATSYGGYWIDYSYWYDEEDTKQVFRVFNEIVFEEISLTTQPANPDTAMEALNKYADKQEKCLTIDDTIISDFINNKMTKKKNKQESALVKALKPLIAKSAEEETEEVEVEEVVNTEEKESTSKEDETPEKVESTEDKSTQEDVDTEEAEEDATEEKSLSEKDQMLFTAIETLSKSVSELKEKIQSLEKTAAARKSVAKVTNDSTKDEEITFKEKVKKTYPYMSLFAKN